MKKIHIARIIIIGVIAMFTMIKNNAFYREDVTRNNDKAINDFFREMEPTDNEIIHAIRGDGNIGNDTTYYTTGWDEINCDITNMAIVYREPGIINDHIIAENSIYILASGDYIATAPITFSGNCTAFIGKNTTNIYSSVKLDQILYSLAKQNLIIDNIMVDNISDGNGGSHARNTYGIRLRSATNNTTTSNISIHGANTAAISMGSDGATPGYNSCRNNNIKDSDIYNNDRVGILVWKCRDNIISNNHVHHNNNARPGATSRGYDGAIWLQSSINTTIENNKVYNNSERGISLESIKADENFNNIIRNNEIYNNGNDYHTTKGGVYMQNSKKNYIINNLIYNNSGHGITNRNAERLTVANNVIFNNSDSGIYIYNTNIYIERPIYYDGSENLYTNNHIFNNSGHGIQSVSNGGNDVSYNNAIYNNSGYGLSALAAFPGIYFGELQTTGNILGDVLNYTAGSTDNSIISGLDREEGRIVNIVGGDCAYGIQIAGVQTDNCQNRGTTARIQANPISLPRIYTFGQEIQKQAAIYKRNTAETAIEIETTESFQNNRFVGQTIEGSVVWAGIFIQQTGNVPITINRGNSTGEIECIIRGTGITELTSTCKNQETLYIDIGNQDGIKDIEVELQMGGYNTTIYQTTFILDTTAPRLSGLTNEINFSNEDFVCSIIEENLSISSITGGIFSGGHLADGTILDTDGNYIISLTDKVGFTANYNITIDKTPPTLSGKTTSGEVEISSGTYYKEPIRIQFTDTNLSGAIMSGIGNPTYQQITESDFIWNQNGTYIFIVEDKAGNQTGLTFGIDQNNIILIEGNISEILLSGGFEITTSGSILFTSLELTTGTFIGTSTINFNNTRQIQSGIVLQSTNNPNSEKIIEVLLPEKTNITANGTVTKPIIIPPTLSGLMLAQTALPTKNIYTTFYAINDHNNNFVFQNESGITQAIRIRIKDNDLTNKTSQEVRYSQDGQVWTSLGTITPNNSIREIESTLGGYFALGENKPIAITPIGGGGGGGGTSYIGTNIICTTGQNCQNPYHNKTIATGQTENTYSQELQNAYQRAYSIGITTLSPIEGANIEGKITRAQLAKMLSVFTQKTMNAKKIHQGSECLFTDTNKITKDLQVYAQLSCTLGIMGLKADGSPDNIFNPSGSVTRAQFATVLSRLLYGEKNNIRLREKNILRYQKHIQAINKTGIMKKISNPAMEEIRGFVMIMLMRANEIAKTK